jgi:hypothetical protein
MWRTLLSQTVSLRVPFVAVLPFTPPHSRFSPSAACNRRGANMTARLVLSLVSRRGWQIGEVGLLILAW